ncbi:MAG: 1-acyl-sn-glycerol-3-phosphate acyltransferase [bacterium]|nr:1-acyl-sn-glycerol-3-phosphate acyltransferase [bacterium]
MNAAAASTQSKCAGSRATLPTHLRIQRMLGRLVFPLLYIVLASAMRFVMGYRIDPEDLRRVRREFRELGQSRDPVLVCANHLTMIDSVIMLWAFAGPFAYTRRFARLCWNVPAVENFAHSFWQRAVTYLAKCLPIDRQGDREHIEGIFDQLRDLLSTGEYVMLFPEGARSRTGRFRADEITYGAGRLVQAVPNCRVFCVYLRGLKQARHSDLPARGERFHISTQTLSASALRTELAGLRGAREISRGIAREIAALEAEFFSRNATADVASDSAESVAA